MFTNRANDKNKQARLLPRIIWTVAWLIQFGLWLFMVFLIGDYWLNEVPTTKNYYAAGLEQGFDGLAGIVAATDPVWEDVRGIKSYDIPSRLNRLQGDTIFHVWTEQDELPSWNSGAAQLKFDQNGSLTWVRRYFVATPPLYATDTTGTDSFSVIKPWLQFRQNSAESATGGAK